MKQPDPYGGKSPAKLRLFIQQCKLIFQNDPSTFYNGHQKVIYALSYLTGKAFEWIQPALDNVETEDPDFILNSWEEFETQIVLIFGDPN